MNYIRLLLILGTIFSTGLAVQPASAQQSSPVLSSTIAEFIAQQRAGVRPASNTDIEDIAVIEPLAYVDSVSATTVASGIISGSFMASNRADRLLGNIQYELLLLSPRPDAAVNQLVGDNPIIYDRQLSHDSFLLGPNSAKEILFNYVLPPVPAGNYRLRVQLRTANGTEMGWDSTNLNLPPNKIPYVTIIPTGVEVESDDPFSENGRRRDWAPLEGPNVNAGETMQLHAQIQANSTEPLTITPTVSHERLLKSGSATTTQTLEPLTLEPGVSQEIVLLTTASAQPGAYRLLLTTSGANTAASLAEYRYVVSGATASLQNVSLEQLGAKRGEQTIVSFSIFGSADRITDTDVIVTAELRDGTRTVAASTQRETLNFATNAANVAGTAALTLTDDICNQANISLTLTSPTGEVFDTYQADVSEAVVVDCFKKVSSVRHWPWSTIGGVIAIILALTGLFLWYRRQQTSSSKKPVPPAPPVATSLFLLAALIGFLSLVGFTPPLAIANGISLAGGNAAYSVVVNKPQHNSTQPDNFEYEARYVVNYCYNVGLNYNFEAHVLRPGGAVDRSTVLAGNQSWERLGGGGPQGYYFGGGCAKCWNAYRDIFATVRFDKPLPESTTLRTYGSNAWWFFSGWSYDYTWVNFAPEPEPPAVDLKINGQDDTVIVNQNEPVALSWTSTGVARCNTGSSLGPEWGGQNAPKAVRGTQILTPGTSQTFGLQCSVTSTSNFVVQDNVGVILSNRSCTDGNDNDNDGLVDCADPGCHINNDPNLSCNPDDNDENDSTPSLPPQCQNGSDDDDDNLVDCSDPGCHFGNDLANACNPLDNNENDTIESPHPQCDNDTDDDGDGLVDCADPGCIDPVTNICQSSDPTESENQPPLVGFTYDSNTVNQPITLNGGASRDPEGGPLDYTWQVDSIELSDQTVVTSFIPDRVKLWVVKLTVTDDRGLSASVAKTINVQAAPITPTPSPSLSGGGTPTPGSGGAGSGPTGPGTVQETD